jgi:hypothetical protein
MEEEQTLIDISCKKEGFKLECGKDTNVEMLTIEEADSDVNYYEENFVGKGLTFVDQKISISFNSNTYYLFKCVDFR